MVDTLKQLTILDDIHITADEKHRYKGISKIKGTFLFISMHYNFSRPNANRYSLTITAILFSMERERK